MGTLIQGLATLRDIHLPPPPGAWPPAPGWWLLGAAVIAAAALLGVPLGRWHRRRRLRKAAWSALRELEARSMQGPGTRAVLIELSTLLRRVALARYRTQEVAGLSGERWLAFLERTGAEIAQTPHARRALVHGAFGAPTDRESTTAALEAARRWLASNV